MSTGGPLSAVNGDGLLLCMTGDGILHWGKLMPFAAEVALPIQARLGHASITTTLNIYGHLMPSAFEGVGERLDELLQRAP